MHPAARTARTERRVLDTLTAFSTNEFEIPLLALDIALELALLVRRASLIPLLAERLARHVIRVLAVRIDAVCLDVADLVFGTDLLRHPIELRVQFAVARARGDDGEAGGVGHAFEGVLLGFGAVAVYAVWGRESESAGSAGGSPGDLGIGNAACDHGAGCFVDVCEAGCSYRARVDFPPGLNTTGLEAPLDMVERVAVLAAVITRLIAKLRCASGAVFCVAQQLLDGLVALGVIQRLPAVEVDAAFQAGGTSFDDFPRRDAVDGNAVLDVIVGGAAAFTDFAGWRGLGWDGDDGAGQSRRRYRRGYNRSRVEFEA